MSAEQQAVLAAIIQGFKNTINVNHLGNSIQVVALADILHTFPDEVRLIWPAPWSLPKVLFLLLRWYLPAHQALAITYALPVGLSPEQCSHRFMRLGVSSIIVVVMSEAVLFIRVYAFSGRDKKVLIYLILQFIAIHATAFVLLTRFLGTVAFVQFPIPNLVCMPAAARSTLLGGVFALFLASVVVSMVIMMVLAFRKNRTFNSSLLNIFYRDGIFYFVCLSGLASANIVVNLAAPEGGFKYFLTQPEINIHVILSTRMILHLRKWAEHERVIKNSSGPLGVVDYSTGSQSNSNGRGYNETERGPSPMHFQDRELIAVRTQTTVYTSY